MEELGGLIIFLILLGLAGLAKLSEWRRRDSDNESRPWRSLSDQPGRTREAIYGDDIPVAKARTPRPSPERRQRKGIDLEAEDEPQSVEDLFEAMVGGEAARARKKQPPSVPQQQARRQQHPTAKPRPRTQQAPPQQGARQPERRPQQPQQQPRKAAPRLLQQQPAATAAQRAHARLESQGGPSPRPSAAKRGIEKTAPVRRRPSGMSTTSEAALIAGVRDELREGVTAARRAIVFSEILGPPRGLKSPDEWGTTPF